MIVVAIIALLAAIAVPDSSGLVSGRKQAKIINDLRLIDAAVDQYAIENNKSTNSVVAVKDWSAYIKSGTALYNTGADLFGRTYGAQTVDSLPKVPAGTFSALSDVAPTDFWSLYGP